MKKLYLEQAKLNYWHKPDYTLIKFKSTLQNGSGVEGDLYEEGFPLDFGS